MSKTVLEEAGEIIAGERREAYGPARRSFERIAAGWSVLLGVEVSVEQVAHCMIWLKLCRETNKPGRDNRVDICGYVALLDTLVMKECGARDMPLGKPGEITELPPDFAG